ncbi:hypothetical protein L218DRAFT_377951 [Marasmius fiardii PR-910]|nr:hypothetical protein L218DRAFT_377951 [Marasmius fiardii PR-910]
MENQSFPYPPPPSAPVVLHTNIPLSIAVSGEVASVSQSSQLMEVDRPSNGNNAARPRKRGIDSDALPPVVISGEAAPVDNAAPAMEIDEPMLQRDVIKLPSRVQDPSDPEGNIHPTPQHKKAVFTFAVSEPTWTPEKRHAARAPEQKELDSERENVKRLGDKLSVSKQRLQDALGDRDQGRKISDNLKCELEALKHEVKACQQQLQHVLATNAQAIQAASEFVGGRVCPPPA